MKIVKPNYDECITNIACSVLNYFNVPIKHNTIKEIDNELKTNPKNVVVILYDGMGYNLINRILPENSFLRENMVKSISSVCPSTTTASTTSMLSGLNPSEHGWLGWDTYIKDEDKIVTLFKNTIKDSDEAAAPYNIGDKYLYYKDLKKQIEEYNGNASIIFPFGEQNIVYTDLNDMNEKILSECKKPGIRFIYAYYQDPDATMHMTGTNSTNTRDVFYEIDESTKELSESLKDTLLIVTADHGHINSSNILLYEYEDFYNTLLTDVSIEPRFCSFRVKPEKEEKFIRLFNKYFKDDFILKSKKEIIDESWFGTGTKHKEFESSLGDYIAIAISDKNFKYREPRHAFLSSHAGLTEDEMKIPLVLKRR